MAATRPESGAWIRRFHQTPGARVRLVCFPHAGGSASYYFPLSKALSPVADVLVLQYPGRQDRLPESPVEDLGLLADAVTEELRGRLDLPTALFGHSMGATVAFETARRLERSGHRPLALFASGRHAPARLGGEQPDAASDAQLIAHVKQLSGTEDGLLDDPDILAMVLPVLRADYRALESYRYRPGPKLNCPVLTMTGDSDPRVSPAEVAEWRDYTTGLFATRVFPGGHFYFTESPELPFAHLTERLTALTPTPAEATGDR